MTPTLRRLAHVNLAVDDVAAARAFYGEVLGLAPAPRPAEASARDGCWFALGTIELHLSHEPGADNARSRRHVAFEVDALDDVRGHLEARGLTLDDGRQVAGMRRFFTRDPAGNRLEFYETVAEAR